MAHVALGGVEVFVGGHQELVVGVQLSARPLSADVHAVGGVFGGLEFAHEGGGEDTVQQR